MGHMKPGEGEPAGLGSQSSRRDQTLMLLIPATALPTYHTQTTTCTLGLPLTEGVLKGADCVSFTPRG